MVNDLVDMLNVDYQNHLEDIKNDPYKQVDNDKPQPIDNNEFYGDPYEYPDGPFSKKD